MTRPSVDSNTYAGATTSTTLCSQLWLLGHDVTERGLGDWRNKGLLPPLERINGFRPGRGATYAWTGPDVLLQAHVLCHSMGRCSRTDYAILLAWFAGFEYDESQIHEVWRTTTERGWRSALESLFDGPFEDEDLPLVFEDLRAPRGRQSALKTVLLRARLVPGLDRVPERDMRQAFEEFCARADPGARDQLRSSFNPQVLQNLLQLYNREFAPVAWMKRLGDCSASDLRQAHDDLKFLFEINRWTLRRIVDDFLTNRADRQVALTMFPAVMVWSGWSLLTLDLLLRNHGMEEQMQATANLLNHPSVQQVLRTVVAAVEQESRGDMSDPNASAARLVERLKAELFVNPEHADVRSDLGALVDALILLWKGKLLRLLDILNCAFADQG
jgi:hypothetical protein